ncbi:MAG: SdpI family protein [Gemmatimonadota bacterium]
MGIRTLWTLESEEVWRKTHRLGGRTFVAGGAVMMRSLGFPTGF